MMLTTITATLLAIPPAVIAITLTLIYCYCAAGRWQWPMILDAGLLALYLWRPSAGVLACGLLLLSIRHFRPFARELAVMGQFDSVDGWTVQLLLFVFPALRAYTQPVSVATSAPDASIMPPVAAGAPAVLPPPVAQPLHPNEWLGAINDDQTAPHLGVVGPTRLGKTTFVLAALSRRAGLLVITTPKSADVDPWAGAAVLRLGYDLVARTVDWGAIERGIDSVHFEMLRRNATNAAKNAPRINLIIDELSTTLANCARKTKSQILEMWNMGAGANIRLIVCDPEVNSAAWGIQGRRDILGNLIFAQVAPGRRWSLGRIDPNGRLIDPQPMDTARLLSLAGEAQLGGRAWAAPSLPAPAGGSGGSGAAVLGGLLGLPAGGSGAGVGAGVPGAGVGGAAPPTAPQSQHTHTHTNAHTESEARIALYMEWRAANITREQGRIFRQGQGQGLDDGEWAEAGKRLKPKPA